MDPKNLIKSVWDTLAFTFNFLKRFKNDKETKTENSVVKAVAVVGVGLYGGVYMQLCQYFGTKGASDIDSNYLAEFSNANETTIEGNQEHLGAFLNRVLGLKMCNDTGYVENGPQEIKGYMLQPPSKFASVGCVSFIVDKHRKGKPYILKTIRIETKGSLNWDTWFIETFLGMGALQKLYSWGYISEEMREFLDNAVPEVCKNIKKEVDLRMEYENLSKAMDNLKDSSQKYAVTVPTLVKDIKNENILIMSCAEGLSLKDWVNTSPPLNLKIQVMCMVSEYYADSLMVKDFSQADCHTGNIFVNVKDSKIESVTVIDFGLCVSLGDSRAKFKNLWNELFKFYDFTNSKIVDNESSQGTIHKSLEDMGVIPACGKKNVIKMISEVCFPKENSLFPRMKKINPNILYPIALIQSLTSMYREICTNESSKFTQLQQLVILFPFSYYSGDKRKPIHYQELISLHECTETMSKFFKLFDTFPIELPSNFEPKSLSDFIIQSALAKYSNKKYLNSKIYPTSYIEKILNALILKMISDCFERHN
eukprot:gene12374-6042_t